MPHTCGPVVSWVILPPSFVHKSRLLVTRWQDNVSLVERGEQQLPQLGTQPSALSGPSPWFYAFWLESGECLFSLGPKTSSSSYTADCSSGLANNLVLRIYLPVSSRTTILFLISSQLFCFPADFYNCVAMKVQVIFILLCICDNNALRNILETS